MSLFQLIHFQFFPLQVLRLSQTNLSNVTSGYVINLVAGDAQRFDMSVMFFFFAIEGSFEVCAILMLTWHLLGYQALAGVLFMVCLSIYYVIMGGVCAKLRKRIAKVTDKRLNSMNAVVPGIRAVKMHAWEWPFMEMVGQLRRWVFLFCRQKYNLHGRHCYMI